MMTSQLSTQLVHLGATWQDGAVPKRSASAGDSR